MRVAVALGLSLFVFVGCGDSGSPESRFPDPGPVDGPIDESRAADAMSHRLCTAWGRCACGEFAGVDLELDTCAIGMRFVWQDTVEEAAALGLTYDGDCLARRLNAMRDRGCEVGPVSHDCGPETCLVFHGDVPEGGACTGRPSASDCAQGLICFGTCQLPCQIPTAGLLAEGERCWNGESVLGTCDPALYCNRTLETCQSLPVLGEPCAPDAAFRCVDARCDFMVEPPVCAAKVELGGACSRFDDCLSENCMSGTCEPPPTLGEMCRVSCAEGLSCSADVETGMASCVEVPREGDVCLPGSSTLRCAEGLACVEDLCIRPAGEGEPCPSLSPDACAGDLLCAPRRCEDHPDLPGCATCDDPERGCLTGICLPEPGTVCADNGGVLITL